jgi:hypothetical protein
MVGVRMHTPLKNYIEAPVTNKKLNVCASTESSNLLQKDYKNNQTVVVPRIPSPAASLS